MSQVKKFFMNVAPSVATISLWFSYIVYNEALIAAIIMSLYTAVLYFNTNKKTFDGIIEVTNKENGATSFQLIVDKDPETFQDQDQVIFLFKDVS